MLRFGVINVLLFMEGIELREIWFLCLNMKKEIRFIRIRIRSYKLEIVLVVGNYYKDVG